MFYKDERLALFIDGANLFAAGKALGFDIDYKLLRHEFMRRGKLLRAFYYTALLESDEYSPIRPLIDWLHYNGYTMVTKPAKEYTDRLNGTQANAMIQDACVTAYAGMEDKPQRHIKDASNMIQAHVHNIGDKGALELIAALGDLMNGNNHDKV
jgi:uncharacterized LabA/DUF88 family protein